MSHRAVLGRVGAVLIVVGLVDVGFMLYCVANGIAYASSLNVLALAAGVALRRGSLGVARIAAHSAAGLVGALFAGLLVAPFLVPARLVREALEAASPPMLVAWGLSLTLPVLALWVYRQLTSDAVRSALDHGIAARRSMAVGALVVGATAIVVSFSLTPSESGTGGAARVPLSASAAPDAAAPEAAARKPTAPNARAPQAASESADSASEPDLMGAPPLVRAHHSFKKGDYRAAIAHYDAALSTDSSNTEALYWRGMAYHRLGRLDLAIADMDACMALGEDNINVYIQADRILMRTREWPRIIDMWTKFIARHPDSATAYAERSGARQRNGDLEGALSDAGEACTLGSRESCQWHARVLSRR
jgi:tetratricopeptide (TPR) repeat protein